MGLSYMWSYVWKSELYVIVWLYTLTSRAKNKKQPVLTVTQMIQSKSSLVKLYLVWLVMLTYSWWLNSLCRVSFSLDSRTTPAFPNSVMRNCHEHYPTFLFFPMMGLLFMFFTLLWYLECMAIVNCICPGSFQKCQEFLPVQWFYFWRLLAGRSIGTRLEILKNKWEMIHSPFPFWKTCELCHS